MKLDGVLRTGSVALAMALFGSALAAQKLTVTPGVSLQVGGTANIAYEDPGKAGQTITVTVSGGFPVPTSYSVQIELDNKGKGSGSWTVVSGWRNAYFDAPGTTGQMIPII